MRPDTTRSRLPLLLGISTLVLALDRISKIFVEKSIPVGDHIQVFSKYFFISHELNPGAAFSLLSDSPSPGHTRLFLVVFTSLVALGVLVALLRMGRQLTATTFGLALVLGGALGNLYDRVMVGLVTDFLEVYLGTYHWPDFNLADSAIVTGCCLLVLDSLRPTRGQSAA